MLRPYVSTLNSISKFPSYQIFTSVFLVDLFFHTHQEKTESYTPSGEVDSILES